MDFLWFWGDFSGGGFLGFYGFWIIFCKDNLYVHRKEAKLKNLNTLFLLNEDQTNDKK